MHRAYLDYNATAPLRPEAREALLAALAAGGNASSAHAEGQAARARVEQGRREVAALVHAQPREVVFTGSGTEAINLAVKGSMRALAFARGEVALSAVEHDAVENAALALGAEGVKTVTLPVDARGVVDLEQARHLIGERTALVAVMVANNETGVIQPVAELYTLARRSGALVLADAVQAAGKIELDFRTLGADFLALSAHKLGGPQGVGALVVRRGAPLEPLIHGGGQEQGLRSGTENTAGIAAFGKAAAAAALALAGEGSRLESLRDQLERGLLSLWPGARVNGTGAARLPNTLGMVLPGVDVQALIVALDLLGVAVSAGSACTSGTAKPSHVLTAMGLPAELARAALRFSLGHATLTEDVPRALAALEVALARQRPAAAGGKP